MNQRLIYIVEDDPVQGGILKAILEAEGFRVRMFEHGLSVLQQIDNDPPDLVISDLVMPKVNGFELLKAMQDHEEHRTVPFIVVSAHKRIDEVDEALIELGADYVLTKPINRTALVSRVRKVFRLLDKAKKSSDRGRNEMSGALTSLSTVELFQVFEQCRKTGIVTVTRGVEQGTASIREGRLVAAEFRRPGQVVRGKEAFVRTLEMKSGNFRFRPVKDLPEGLLNESINEILLTWLVRQDHENAETLSSTGLEQI